MARLFVGNLPNDAREDDVRRMFAEKAQLRELIMKSGYAFVEYNDADTAEAVRRELDGSDFAGKSMRIDRAKPKPDREDRRRDGYGGGGYGREGGYRDDRRGGYGDDRRYGDRYEDRRGGAPPAGYGDRYEDRRGGYDDRRGGYGDRFDDRRGGDRRGGYDRPRYDRAPREGRHNAPHSSEFGLAVDGLPHGTDWRDIKDHFRPMGSVCFASFKNGQGIVQFENEEALLSALKAADGTSIRGHVITVSRLPSSSAAAPSSSDAGLQRSPSPARQADSPGAN